MLTTTVQIAFSMAITEAEHIDGLVQEKITPVRYQWSYVFLALTHQYETVNSQKDTLVWYPAECN